MLRHILRLLGITLRKSRFDPDPALQYGDPLDYYWDDDTIDIKNYRNMDPGKAKDKMQKMLQERMDWYIKEGLEDWADQIYSGLHH